MIHLNGRHSRPVRIDVHRPVVVDQADAGAVRLANESAMASFADTVDAVTGRANVQVAATADGFDERLYARIRRQPGVGSYYVLGLPSSPTTIAINRPGRYVRIQMAHPARLDLAEVQVWSDQSSAP